jgi:hypothetical protein
MNYGSDYTLSAYDPAKRYQNHKSFDCGHKVVNDYINKKTIKTHTQKNYCRCFVVTDGCANIVAFYTLQACSVEREMFKGLVNNSLPTELSCLKIGMLGVDTSYKRKRVGTMLILDALDRMQIISEHCGLFGIYLDADPNAINFYLNNNFIPLATIQYSYTTPMFIGYKQ